LQPDRNRIAEPISVREDVASVIPLLAGVVEGVGIVGIYDAAGIGTTTERAVAGLVGGRMLLPVRGAETRERGGALVQGEIFNLEDVALELGLPGSCAETLVEAGFGRWSRDLVTRLRGSFALVAVADDRALVAADASAGHSIVFHTSGSRLVFASEIHLLLKLLPVRPAANQAGLVHWLADGTSPPVGETLYEGVSELLGGECIELGPDGWARSRCWTPRYEPPADISRREAGALLWEALVDAVGARLGRDEDVGIVMSSGVDSSAVAAAAVAAVGPDTGRIRSYSAVFPDEPGMDESARILALVATLGIRNTRIPPEPGHAFDQSLEWLAAWELPLYDLNYQLERPLLELAAREGVLGLLDGQWGDESFGAPTFLPADLLRRGRLLESIRVARLLRTNHLVGGQQPWRSYALMGALPLGLERRYLRLRPSTPRYLTAASARLVVETDSARDWKAVHAPRWWAEKMHLLAVDRQVAGISRYVRQRAALSGLRARPPLFDVAVMETLLRIPPIVEFDPVFDRATVREAMKGHIPESLRSSRWKSDVGPFYLAGLGGPELHRVRDVLSEPREVSAFARADVIRAMIENPPKWSDPGSRAWVVGVWKLVTAECWLRFQADRAVPEQLLQRDR
jgi:asparagine synthase (glutamine-hydrolysing)